MKYITIVFLFLWAGLLHGFSDDWSAAVNHLAPDKTYVMGFSRKIICVTYGKDNIPGVSFIYKRNLMPNTLSVASWKQWSITTNVAMNSQVYFSVDSVDLKIPGWDFFRLYDKNKNCRQVVGVFEAPDRGLTSQWLLPLK